MPVPETSVCKNDCPVFGENHIRLSWKTTVIDPVAESERKQPFSDGNLYAGITGADAGHHPAAGLPVYNISHGDKIPQYSRKPVFSLS